MQKILESISHGTISRCSSEREGPKPQDPHQRKTQQPAPRPKAALTQRAPNQETRTHVDPAPRFQRPASGREVERQLTTCCVPLRCRFLCDNRRRKSSLPRSPKPLSPPIPSFPHLIHLAHLCHWCDRGAGCVLRARERGPLKTGPLPRKS